jgi:hypothetical protein
MNSATPGGGLLATALNSYAQRWPTAALSEFAT